SGSTRTPRPRSSPMWGTTCSPESRSPAPSFHSRSSSKRALSRWLDTASGQLGADRDRIPPVAPDIGAMGTADPKMLSTVEAPIIAVVNQKGGVGKTTTAINLGAALAELGHSILLVDLDPQANSTSGLGHDPIRARLNVYHLLSGEAGVEQAAVLTSAPGMMLVPSHIDLAGAEIELATLSARETRLRKALADLPPGVGCVIIDCPPSLGLLTLNALTAATSMLIPTQCEYFALEGLRHLVYTHQLVRSRLNPKLGIAGIVMTQFDART